MKETLDDLSRKELIQYRLSRAEETLKEAAYNADGAYFNAAVNRLYYACFYAASALMLAYNLEASTHSGIRTMLGLKFIRTGLMDPKYGRTYQQLFDSRQSGDYEDFVYCDKEMFSALTPRATEFVEAIKRMIAPQN